jgi:dolichol-phosphate mannosyltransferase
MMYSIVVPIKDEEENIPLLVEELESVMIPLKANWELICVDDGSCDKSLDLLKNLSEKRKNMKTIAFTRNFGQSSAFAAGFRAALGKYVITLDADLQNDPKDIPKLIEGIEGYDMVCGWRASRKDPWNKKIISKFANFIRSRFCQDGMHDTGCSLKIYRREALEKIPMYKGMHRFLPALFLIEGYKVKEVPVSHRPRYKGETKYRFFNRLFGPIMDMMVVRWMRMRHLKHEIREVFHDDRPS